MRIRLRTLSKAFIAAILLCFYLVSHAQSLNCPPSQVFYLSSGCDTTVSYLDPVGTVQDADTFYYVGMTQQWVVPAGVDSIMIEAWGAEGMWNSNAIRGGYGGYATGKLGVTPGETLYVEVGNGGFISTSGGYNGGGNAGAVGCSLAFGGGGGGASDVRQGGNGLANRVIVAAGGGGAAGDRVSTCGRGTGGGGGGGYYGGGGGAAWPNASLVVPTGGTQSSGGIGGTSTYISAPNNNGTAGSLGQGGNGGDEVTSNQGGSYTAAQGGVGGGLTGADGSYSGSFTGQSGAGGSSYIGGVVNGSTSSVIHSSDGLVIISYDRGAVLVSGLASGSTFPAGTTTQVFVLSNSISSDTCSFDITVVPAPLDSLITGTPVCDGTVFTLLADPGFASYLWNTGSTSDTTMGTISGIYWVEVTDSNGCVNRDSTVYQTLALPAPVISFVNPDLCTQAFAAYQWFENGNPVGGANGQCFTPTIDATYTVVVTDSNGCTGEDIFVYVGNSTPMENGFSLHPNPAIDQLKISFDAPIAGEILLQVIDLQGKIVSELQIESAQKILVIPVSDIPAGTYLLRMRTELGTSQRSFVRMPQ